MSPPPPVKGVGGRSNFDPSRPLYTQDTSFSVKSSLTAVCQGVQTLSTDIFAPRCDRAAHTPTGEMEGKQKWYVVSVILSVWTFFLFLWMSLKRTLKSWSKMCTAVTIAAQPPLITLVENVYCSDCSSTQATVFVSALGPKIVCAVTKGL